MKIYKILKHQELITEVMNQVALRFTPQIKIINKYFEFFQICIDQLIEQEYLKRQPNNNNIYEYLT